MDDRASGGPALFVGAEALTWAHGAGDPARPRGPYDEIVEASNDALYRAASDRLAKLLPGVDFPAIASAPEVSGVVHGACNPAELARRLPTTDEIDDLMVLSDQADSRFDAYRDGGRLDAEEFLYRRRPGAMAPARVRAGKAGALSADGLTIQLNNVDDQDAKASALAADFETVFGADVFVNVFLSNLGAAGLGSHWDAPDLLLLQIEGRKAWQISPPTVPNAMRGYGPDNTAGEVVWDSVLEPGEALLVPSAWFHRAIPSDGHSLSVTVGINRPKLIESFEFLRDIAYLDDRLRTKLGHGSTDAGLPAEIAGALHQSITPANLSRFRWFRRAGRGHRNLNRFSTVRNAITRGTVADHVVSARIPGGLAVCQHLPSGETVLAGGGIVMQLAGEAVPIVARLITGSPTGLDELVSWSGLDRQRVDQLLLSLLTWDFIEVTDRGRHRSRAHQSGEG